MCVIDEYKDRWFSEESEKKIMDDIYKKYARPNENRIKFFTKTFILRWEERFVELSLTPNTTCKIEDLAAKNTV